MTGHPGEPDEPAAPDALTEAAAGIERLRETLQRVARSELPPRKAREALEEYLRDHGPAVSKAAAAIAEQVRAQLLTELRRRRAQIHPAEPAGPATRDQS